MIRTRYGTVDWVIASANSWISGRPSIDKIINENQRKGTIMVVQRYNNLFSDTKPVKCFILGSQGNYGKIGDTIKFTKDTGMGYSGLGKCVIENIIHISEDSLVSSINEIGINEKRSLYVFK